MFPLFTLGGYFFLLLRLRGWHFVTLGALIALYEHRIHVQSILSGVSTRLVCPFAETLRAFVDGFLQIKWVLNSERYSPKISSPN